MRWCLFILAACGAPMLLPDAGAPDAGAPPDAGKPPVPDAGRPDAGVRDAGVVDAGAPPYVPPVGPLLLASSGGPVLHAAWLVTVAYPDVPAASELTALGDALPDSGWLRTVGAQYGVGLLGHTHYDLAAAAPATFTDDDVAALVEQGLDAGWWVEPDAGTPLWLVLYPPATVPAMTVFNYTGEHFQTAGGRVAAWVAPHEDAGVAFYELVMGHEVVEALTDPYISFAPAYRMGSLLLQEAHGFNTELADLCEGFDPIQSDGFTLPRIWSNAAADAGSNPCVPEPPSVAPWAVVWGPLGAVQLDPGQQVDLALPALSPEGAGTWALSVFANGDPTLDLEVPATATAGQNVTVTVIAPFYVARGASAVFMLVSTVDGGELSSTPIPVTVR